MNRIGVVPLILMAVMAGCEKGVKPAGAPSPKAAAAVKKETSDQTPELDGHPRALYDHGGREAERLYALSEKLRQQNLEMQQPILSPKPIAKDGFIQTANHLCPVMQKMKLNETTAVEHTVEFEGKVIGFCCEDCLDAWASMSDDERRDRVKTVMGKK